MRQAPKLQRLLGEKVARFPWPSAGAHKARLGSGSECAPICSSKGFLPAESRPARLGSSCFGAGANGLIRSRRPKAQLGATGPKTWLYFAMSLHPQRGSAHWPELARSSHTGHGLRRPKAASEQENGAGRCMAIGRAVRRTRSLPSAGPPGCVSAGSCGVGRLNRMTAYAFRRPPCICLAETATQAASSMRIPGQSRSGYLAIESLA